MENAIRRAVNTDCVSLTRIVQSSQAYPGEYQQIVENIEFTPAHLQRDAFYVFESGEQVAGFYSLKQKDDSLELDFMFVDDAFQGQGIGRKLMLHMKTEVLKRGYIQVEIVAHPPAEAFYARMGAVRIGMQPPQERITWERPHMILAVNDEQSQVRAAGKGA